MKSGPGRPGRQTCNHAGTPALGPLFATWFQPSAPFTCARLPTGECVPGHVARHVEGVVRKRDSNPRPRHYEPRIPHVAQLRCGALQFNSYRGTTFTQPLGSMLGERIPANRLEPACNPVNERNWNRAGTASTAGPCYDQISSGGSIGILVRFSSSNTPRAFFGTMSSVESNDEYVSWIMPF